MTIVAGLFFFVHIGNICIFAPSNPLKTNNMKRLLQVCFIAAMVFGLASCSKEENNSGSNGGNGGGSGPNTQTSLVGTQWAFNDGEADITVSFTTATDVSVDVQTPHGSEHYQGTYTYSNGNGTIALVMGSQTMNITFTVNGNTMTAYNTPSGDVTLTLVGGNPQPQPGPQPGGNYPLNGTTWQTSFQEDGLYMTMSVSFSTTTCLLVYADSDGDSEQMTGTYTYTGTLTSGQGTISFQGEHGPETGTFTVNGNQATVTADGESHVFTRVTK